MHHTKESSSTAFYATHLMLLVSINARTHLLQSAGNLEKNLSLQKCIKHKLLFS